MLDFFNNPPAQYRPMPFWFWNAELNPAEIERQIHEMHLKGIGGFFIHGRFGLRTEYMGETWMRCIEHACNIAQELGMHVYLYDENPFPSGVAGGHAMQNEQHFGKYLDITRLTATPGETIRFQSPEGELISATAVDIEHPARQIDLTDQIQDSILSWTAPKCKFEIVILTAAVARSRELIYGSEPDYFDSSLLNTFFSFTHDHYADRLKPYFGKVIKGIFTDEPKVHCAYHLHEDASTTAWFADLFNQFKKDHGYDLKPHLACLATDAGPMTGKVRRDYWSTIANAYIERFFTRYRRWCDENGITFTGHLFLEEGLYANTMFQGDSSKVLSTFAMPGIDHLALEAENEYGIPNIPRSITRTAGEKLATSIAHLIGSQRILSETYGCCGWNLSLENMKWIFNWQASLGVNFLCPHAFYYSIAGNRKADAPPSEFYQATYWPYFKMFADYAARLSYILSQGKHRAQVGLLYPIKGFQSEWTPGRQGPIDKLIAEYFDIYCAYLLKEHIDYDILPEDAIKKAAVFDERMFIGDEEYELLIIPPTTAIGLGTAEKIQELIEEGGKVIGTQLLPVEDADGNSSEEVRDIIQDIFHRDPVQLRNNVASGTIPAHGSFSGSPAGAFFLEGGSQADLIKHLRTYVSQAIKPEVSVKSNNKECHDITYLHRTMDRTEIYYFANNALKPREVQISIRCDGAPYMLNPDNGALTALPNCTQRASRTLLFHRFERCGTLIVAFSDEPALAVAPPTYEMGDEYALSNDWIFEPCGHNCLTLPDWNLNMLAHTWGTHYDYVTAFESEFVPQELFLVLDDMPAISGQSPLPGSTIRVFVNDTEISGQDSWICDINWQSLDIAPLVRKGTNRVRIFIDHGGWSGEPSLVIAPPRLMGSFSIDESNSRLIPPRTTIRTGSWTDQGHPYYSGAAVYKQEFTIPDFMQSQRVVLRAEDPADMVEFIVNGVQAGVRPWSPFEIDITHLVKPGPNKFELKITNSLSNMLISEIRPSGLLGGAKLIIY